VEFKVAQQQVLVEVVLVVMEPTMHQLLVLGLQTVALVAVAAVI
jgi:hypothetical protein